MVRWSLQLVGVMTLVVAMLWAGSADAKKRKRPRRHIVKPGESLSLIARQYGCVVDNFLRWNKDITNPDAIRPGQKLKVPRRCKGKPIAARAFRSGGAPSVDVLAGYRPDRAFCAGIRQAPQKRYFRSNYRGSRCGTPKQCRKKHRAFTQYRTQQFGHFPGFGDEADNGHSPKYYSQTTTFMGRSVRLNRLVIPPLKCAERAIRRQCKKCVPDPKLPGECSKYPYTPRSMSGLRYKNTFRGGEVSNHVYGIAIDLDPKYNTCCGCVGKWRRHPKCRKKLPKHQRMIMPMCWVDVFEEYGFYWLGHDALQDTMHFEFLGKPDRVLKALKKQRAER